MQFYKKRPTSAAVPIVPMIDILTILLIFFIIHTQWRKPQHFLKIDVPSTEYIQGSETEVVRDVLTVSADSQIMFNGQIVTVEQLPDLLRQYKRDNPGKMLQQDIDKKAPVEMLVKIFDALTAAGIDVTEVPFRINTKSPATGEESH